jgi:RimJ/RimL family protein N-acetyltransferase
MRPIITPRCVLEPLTRSHAPALYAQLADPAIYAFIDEAVPQSLEALTRRYAMLEGRHSPDGTQHWLNWVIRLPEEGAVGYVQATVYANRSADIAYVLAPHLWGRGLARYATAAMLRELADAWGVVRFFARAERANARSLRLLAGLGFAAADPAMHGRRALAPTELLLYREALPAVGASQSP